MWKRNSEEDAHAFTVQLSSNYNTVNDQQQSSSSVDFEEEEKQEQDSLVPSVESL